MFVVFVGLCFKEREREDTNSKSISTCLPTYLPVSLCFTSMSLSSVSDLLPSLCPFFFLIFFSLLFFAFLSDCRAAMAAVLDFLERSSLVPPDQLQALRLAVEEAAQHAQLGGDRGQGLLSADEAASLFVLDALCDVLNLALNSPDSAAVDAMADAVLLVLRAMEKCPAHTLTDTVFRTVTLSRDGRLESSSSSSLSSSAAAGQCW